jgi:hypothetical protein
MSSFLRLPFVLCVVVIITLLIWRARASRLVRQCMVVAACYMGMVGASRLLGDPGIPLDERMMSPLFLMIAIALGTSVAIAMYDERVQRRGMWGVLVFITFFMVIRSGMEAAAMVSIYREDGGDLNQAEWRDSPLMRYVNALPQGTRIYSNWPAAIWFHTGRSVLILPRSLDSLTIAGFQKKIGAENGVVIAFPAPTPEVPDADSIAAHAGLHPHVHAGKGSVWGVAP